MGESFSRLVNMAKFVGLLLMLLASSYIGLVSSMSVADAEAELVRSSYGLYGLPNYRPFGFTYAGYGSVGYGFQPTFIKSPNIYAESIKRSNLPCCKILIFLTFLTLA